MPNGQWHSTQALREPQATSAGKCRRPVAATILIRAAGFHELTGVLLTMHIVSHLQQAVARRQQSLPPAAPVRSSNVPPRRAPTSDQFPAYNDDPQPAPPLAFAVHS